MTPFDIKRVIDTKENQPDSWDETWESGYVPFIINKAYSFNLQTILFAAELNKYPFIPKQQQFSFLLHALPKAKRFDKWLKSPQKEKDVEMLQIYYSINRFEAEQVINLLTAAQLNEIRRKTNKGGKNG